MASTSRNAVPVVLVKAFHIIKTSVPKLVLQHPPIAGGFLNEGLHWLLACLLHLWNTPGLSAQHYNGAHHTTASDSQVICHHLPQEKSMLHLSGEGSRCLSTRCHLTWTLHPPSAAGDSLRYKQVVSPQTGACQLGPFWGRPGCVLLNSFVCFTGSRDG